MLLFVFQLSISVLYVCCFPVGHSQLAGALRPPPAGFAAGRFSQKLPAARLKPLRQPASVGQSVSESVSQRKSEPVSQRASESVGESVGERKLRLRLQQPLLEGLHARKLHRRGAIAWRAIGQSVWDELLKYGTSSISHRGY